MSDFLKTAPALLQSQVGGSAPVKLENVAGDYYYSPTGQQRLLAVHLEEDAYLHFWLQGERNIEDSPINSVTPLLRGVTIRYRGHWNGDLHRQPLLSTAVQTMHFPAGGQLEVEYSPDLSFMKTLQFCAASPVPLRVVAALATKNWTPSERRALALPVPPVGTEQQVVIPAGTRFVQPTVNPADLGARIWLHSNLALQADQLIPWGYSNVAPGIDTAPYNMVRVYRYAGNAVAQDYNGLQLRCWA